MGPSSLTEGSPNPTLLLKLVNTWSMSTFKKEEGNETDNHDVRALGR